MARHAGSRRFWQAPPECPRAAHRKKKRCRPPSGGATAQSYRRNLLDGAVKSRFRVGLGAVYGSACSLCAIGGRGIDFLPPRQLSRMAQDRAACPTISFKEHSRTDCIFPSSKEEAQTCLAVVDRNAEENVIWIHSHMTSEKDKSFCIYDASSPETIRRVASHNNLPVDSLVEVRVLDPYFYFERQA